ncbi:MAG: type ISP restriction/modification enzyme [Pirellulaceae bacterium]
MAEHPLRPLVCLTRQLQEAVLEVVASARGPWPGLGSQFAQRTGDLDTGHFADAVAQAVTCGLYAVATEPDESLPAAARQWLLTQADPLLEHVLRMCLDRHAQPLFADAADTAAARIARYLAKRPADVARAGPHAGPHAPPGRSYFFEEFLSQYSAQSRRRQGVYYTPPELASYVVRSIDDLLRTEFALEDGLADRSPWQEVRQRAGTPHMSAVGHPTASFVRLLDPAMGTGVFLLAAFDHIRHWWEAQRSTQTVDDWSEFVTRTVLPRLCGQELMLPAVVVAQLLMTARLVESGYNFRQPGKLSLHLGNTLFQPRIGDTGLVDEAHPYTIVLGNPPFAGVSDNHDPWVRQLLRGRAPGTPQEVANYFQVDGQPLGEKKHWLEDDYVKFVRLAHWLIEAAGTGIVGLVTNHGFLDNVTFRGMRQQLLSTFSRIGVVDLHGNTRTGERSPDGGPDESVFGIEQGVAVTLFCRPVRSTASSCIEHVSLWGRRSEKLHALLGGPRLPGTPLEPCTPNYFLAPHDRSGDAEYARGYRLSDIMPVNSTAPVTARDSFVVAFSEAELQERIAVLGDSNVSDEEIRRRYFTSGRSTKYPAGDTRGWRLAEARERIRREPDWRQWIRDCLYRPFDRRKIFWIAWMIDWPRDAIMAHLATGNNVALVARRQVPASQPCNYFWITDTITLDGLVRSDNRGSESVFPLYLAENIAGGYARALRDGRPAFSTVGPRRPNFSADFVDRFASQLNLSWNAETGAVRAEQFTPWELFCYIYALLHAPSYRQRFAAWLRIDFPRVFVPVQSALFRSLSLLGAQLVEHHLLRGEPSVRVAFEGPLSANQVGAGFPRWAQHRIYLNRDLSVGPVAQNVWEFRVGTHQVCRKWLKDRRGRELLPADLLHFGRLVTALDDTLICMRQIDQEIDRCGGWNSGFA